MSEIPAVSASTTWQDLDSHAETATHYLDLVASTLSAYKNRSMDLLALSAGMMVLDVGCGNGRDAETLAERIGSTGRVIGIDTSRELIDQAVARTIPLNLPVNFRLGNAQAMDFPDNSFDAARVDRVLQHLPDPARAVSEMVRVVRPGGRVVALEPDWEMVAVNGGELAVGRAVQRHVIEISITQGTIGRELRRLLVGAGCRAVTFEPIGVPFGDLTTADNILFLRSNLEGAVAKGWITTEDAVAWWNALEEQDRAGTFYAAIHGVIAAGTVA
jgi:ubiquinone/menaquinone biosynthesis C-methylase UbiE